MSEIVALTTLVCKLASLVQNEVNLHRSIRQDVGRVKRELQHIHAFLRHANDGPATEQQHEVWVKQVREAALQAEDILDENILNVTPDQQWGSCSCFYFKNRHMASELKKIISLFEEVSKTNKRYRTYKSGSVGRTSQPAPQLHNGQADAYFLNETDLVGIEKGKKHLTSLLLTEDTNLKVISVVGMGGIGKTTLVKKVFDEVDVKSRFECHARIIVTQTYVKLDILRNLINQLQKERLEPVEDEGEKLVRFATQKLIDESLQTMNAIELTEKVHELLAGKSYLIVIDDLWSIDDWSALKSAFPETNSCSRLVITTRDTDTASSASTSEDHIYQLKGLSERDSWTLFCRKAFSGGDSPSNLLEVSKRILRKCDSLPLAIATISGLLKNKKTLSEWEAVESNIRNKSIENILKLSYDDLPDHLRPCYLYLSIFPEDYRIKRNIIIRLWIAEGFIEDTDGVRTLEEIAESYLRELINKSMIVVTETTADGRVKTCRIHDLLRVMIRAKSRDQNFTSVAIAGETFLENPRRIFVHNSLSNIRKVQKQHYVRSLLLFRIKEVISNSSMPELFSRDFKLLTVLDLEGSKLDSFPTAIVRLSYLRYLSMRNTEIRNIPSTIGMLQRLETLDLKHTFVSSFPTEIQTLQRLRHLLVYNYYGGHGFKAPKGIKYLKSLQGICDVDVEHENNGILEELGMLTQLKRLGIDGVNEINQVAVLASVQRMINLQSLTLQTTKNEIMSLESWQTTRHTLKRLSLVGQLNSMPQSIVPSLKNLVKIQLIKSQLVDDPLEKLEQLLNLVQIQMDSSYQGTLLLFKSGKFRLLKVLHLCNFSSLLNVSIESTAMPDLHELSIIKCGSLRGIPSGIKDLYKLNICTINGASPKLIGWRPILNGTDYSRVGLDPM